MSIRLEHVSYAYEDNSSRKNYALKDVNLETNEIELNKIIYQNDAKIEVPVTFKKQVIFTE